MGDPVDAPGKKNQEAARVAETTGVPADDADLLRVYGQLDLADQLDELAEQVVCRSGMDAAVAYACRENPRVFMPVAGTVPEEARGELPTDRLDPAWAAEQVRDGNAWFEGLGPLAGIGEGWPVRQPGSVGLVGVRGTDDTLASLLLVFGAEFPTEEARESVRRLVEGCRRAVSNALQVRAIRELVIKDDTAECYNRRYFDQYLLEELARATRFRTPMSLIFLDMDNLKEVNTRLGHSMGSRTLWEVSARVRGRIRKFDKLFRFGGDEFCIVLPETEWHGAMEVAERVREAIAGFPFLESERGVGNGVGMTASLGVASFPLHARTREELVQRADRAMQYVKNGSKNGIAVAEILKD